MLGIEALAIVDRNSLAGIVRAHEAARTTGVRLIVGCCLDLADGPSVLVYPTCALGGRLYDGSRVETVWTSPQVGAFLHQTQYCHMHVPLLIGPWTGQREGDILRLKWSAYDGQVIRLKQRKGQRRGKRKNASAIVVIPVAEPLKAALDAARAARLAAKVTPLKLEDEAICLNSEGEPWREGRDGFNGFISSFRKAKEKAGIEGVSLRGTAVRRLALSGCTVPEICAITGHSHAEANAILEAHYLHRATRQSPGTLSGSLKRSTPAAPRLAQRSTNPRFRRERLWNTMFRAQAKIDKPCDKPRLLCCSREQGKANDIKWLGRQGSNLGMAESKSAPPHRG